MRRHAWNCDLSTKPGTDILTNCHIHNYTYLDIQKLHFFWSGLKSSERAKIEQLLILPSVSHIWKNQKYDAKWRRKDAKDQLFDTKAVSLNPSLLAQEWFLGPRPKIHKDRKLCGSRTVQVHIYIYIFASLYKECNNQISLVEISPEHGNSNPLGYNDLVRRIHSWADGIPPKYSKRESWISIVCLLFHRYSFYNISIFIFLL